MRSTCAFYAHVQGDCKGRVDSHNVCVCVCVYAVTSECILWLVAGLGWCVVCINVSVCACMPACVYACCHLCMPACASSSLASVYACKCLVHVCSQVCAVLDRAMRKHMSSLSTKTYGGFIFRMFSHFTSWKNSHFFSSAAPDLDPSLFDGSLHSCVCVYVCVRAFVCVCVCVCVC